jgi:hypothetical protein
LRKRRKFFSNPEVKEMIGRVREKKATVTSLHQSVLTKKQMKLLRRAGWARAKLGPGYVWFSPDFHIAKKSKKT